MPKIKDLKKDINDLLTGLGAGKGVEVSDELLEKTSKDFIDALKNALRPREQRARPKDRLAPTELGETCLRKIWYSRQSEQTTENLTASNIVKFLYGDLLEVLLLFLVQLSGHEVSRQQEVMEDDYPQTQGSNSGLCKVRGRIDAAIDGVLVDVKSSSGYGFSKFLDGLTDANDKFGYRAQLEAYQAGTGSRKSGFLAINKENGQIAYHERPTTPEKARKQTAERVQKLWPAVVSETIPPFQPEFKPVEHGKKNHKLCTKCSYCPYKYECWSEANHGEGLKGFRYSNGPVYLTEVREEPRVPMITPPKKEQS